MDRQKQIEEQARKFVEQYAASSGLESETANTLKMWYELGAKWADAHQPQDTSLIKWQTDDPKEDGCYLVTVKGTYDIFVSCAYYSHLRGWSHWANVLAWCKLSDIKPYKEEAKWNFG